MREADKYGRGKIQPELFEETDDVSLEHTEKMHLSKTLRRFEWNKSKTSKALGISRATLRAKIKKYNLSNN